MNPPSAEKAISLALEIIKYSVFDNVEIMIAPPFVFLESVAKALRSPTPKAHRSRTPQLGAQDVFYESAGAFTGEVSAAQLKGLGVTHVIVGHSERRALGETDEIVGKKLAAVLEAGMTPILCVGEPEDVRAKGAEAAKEFVEKQLKESDSKALRSRTPHSSLVVAYEPVWAIGTGNNATPDDAAEMAAFIKSRVTGYGLRVPVLYGGSVTSGNASNFLNREEIDGLLVGGASLNAEEFGEICRGA